jgi:phosphoribosyl 1,2-cyclic phosphodiesterase
MLTCSLQSGSNGNAIYVEANGTRLLFDAGISGRQAAQRLATHNRHMRDVDALILSHGHADHTRCAGVYQRLFGLPIYLTATTHRAIAAHAGRLRDVRRFTPGATLEINDVRVHTLPTPHDFNDSVAFIIEHEKRRLGILTDLGHPFHELARVLPELDAAYLESNYDPEMLENGPYPPHLKARIRGDYGHISNVEAAELLRSCRRRPEWVALAHLSGENNDPALALQTHRAALGRSYPLHIAGRYNVSSLFTV